MTTAKEPRTLVDEARASFDLEASGAEIDWAQLETKLFARVDREARVRRAHATHGGGLLGRFAAGGLALAAGAALFLGRPPHRAPASDAPAREASSSDEGARALGTGGALTSTEAAAEVQIEVDGAFGKSDRLSPGTLLSRGDRLEAKGGAATFDRGRPFDPGSTRWLLEKGSLVRVARADGTLVLALEHGAIEAQVTPVPRGEAFAVDVGRTRIAVHGTHLRVQRESTKVVVDLSEGVVLIGDAPRAGETHGTLVMAPAHVEFDTAGPSEADGLAGAPEVSHLPARVRPAKALGASDELSNAAPSVVRPPRSAFSPPAPPAPPSAPVNGPSARPDDGARVAPTIAPADSGSASTKNVELKPSDAIVRAVQRCAEAHVGDHPGVVVTVSSRLELHVGADGRVTTARFAPPLAPELQSCASPVIYEVRFPRPGVAVVPLDFKR